MKSTEKVELTVNHDKMEYLIVSLGNTNNRLEPYVELGRHIFRTVL